MKKIQQRKQKERVSVQRRHCLGERKLALSMISGYIPEPAVWGFYRL